MALDVGRLALPPDRCGGEGSPSAPLFSRVEGVDADLRGCNPISISIFHLGKWPI
jgi:hypothetical protein